MTWLLPIFSVLFPSRYTKEELQKILLSPEPDHKNIYALYDYHNNKGKELIYYIKSRQDRVLSHYIAQEMHKTLKEYLSEQQQFSFFLNPLVMPMPITEKNAWF